MITLQYNLARASIPKHVALEQKVPKFFMYSIISPTPFQAFVYILVVGHVTLTNSPSSAADARACGNFGKILMVTLIKHCLCVDATERVISLQ